MGSIKVLFLLSTIFFGLIALVLIRHFNSGIGGSLASKRWALIIGSLSLIISIGSAAFFLIGLTDYYKVVNIESEKHKSELDEIDRSLSEIGLLIDHSMGNLNDTTQYLKQLEESKTMLKSIVIKVSELVDSLSATKNNGIEKLLWGEIIIACLLSVLFTSIFNQVGKLLKTLYKMLTY